MSSDTGNGKGIRPLGSLQVEEATLKKISASLLTLSNAFEIEAFDSGEIFNSF